MQGSRLLSLTMKETHKKRVQLMHTTKKRNSTIRKSRFRKLQKNLNERFAINLLNNNYNNYRAHSCGISPSLADSINYQTIFRTISQNNC